RQLGETLDMHTNTGAALIADSFGTHNQFWGGQLGAEGEVNRGRYFINAYAKVAVGDLRQSVNINGVTDTGAGFVPGGFYAQPTNMGHFRRDRISRLPDAGRNIGMRRTNSLRSHCGHSVM